MADIVESPPFADPTKQNLGNKHDKAVSGFLRLVELGKMYAKEVGSVGTAFLVMLKGAEKDMKDTGEDLKVGS